MLHPLPFVFVGAAFAGSMIWDGRFNDYKTSKDLDLWSFDNPHGSYQWYIFGNNQPTQRYVNLSPDFKNPGDYLTKQGVKISIDPSSVWKNQTDKERTELIPEPNAQRSPINQGLLFYHFSMKRSNTNAPVANFEHQICFFENHFTEMLFGDNHGSTGPESMKLQWLVNKTQHWAEVWDADVWHNIAYQIDFDRKLVGFWHSTGSEPLQEVVEPIDSPVFSDSKDWHLGVLRLNRPNIQNEGVEDYYFSGVYVETAPVTTSIRGGGGQGMTSRAGLIDANKLGDE